MKDKEIKELLMQSFIYGLFVFGMSMVYVNSSWQITLGLFCAIWANNVGLLKEKL